MDRYFPHEKLTCYQLAVSVSRWFRATDFPTGDADLKDQGKRAAASIVLNIAEGSRSTGGNRAKHFGYAMASAAEACAVLDIVDVPGISERRHELRRIGGMVRKLR